MLLVCRAQVIFSCHGLCLTSRNGTWTIGMVKSLG